MLQTALDGEHFRLRVTQGNAGFQARDGMKGMVIANGFSGVVQRQREIQPSLRREIKFGSEDADYGVAAPVQLNGLSENVGI
jgi:hypothetical protein